MSETIIKKEYEHLNKNAKEYIPTKKRIPEIIDFSLTKREYRPKQIVEYVEVDDDEEEEDDENEINEKVDMIIKDMVEDDIIEEMGNEESEDEDKWFPKYKDCECCQGFIFKCKGQTCADLGQCYCKMKDECDKQVDKENK
jgi:hypothetical protein